VKKSFVERTCGNMGERGLKSPEKGEMDAGYFRHYCNLCWRFRDSDHCILQFAGRRSRVLDHPKSPQEKELIA
jgi:hypothetical protein